MLKGRCDQLSSSTAASCFPVRATWSWCSILWCPCLRMQRLKCDNLSLSKETNLCLDHQNMLLECEGSLGNTSHREHSISTSSYRAAFFSLNEKMNKLSVTQLSCFTKFLPSTKLELLIYICLLPSTELRQANGVQRNTHINRFALPFYFW